MSEAEDRARTAIDASFDSTLAQVLPDVLTREAAAASARRVLAEAWPQFPVTTIALIDSADAAFLSRRLRIEDFGELDVGLTCAMLGSLQPLLDVALPGNKYVRSGKLRSRIRERVAYRRPLIERAVADSLVKLEAAGPFPSPDEVRSRVIRLLASFCISEANTPRFDPRSLAHHLKVLAFLATCSEEGIRRRHILGRLTNGRSRAYPLVPRYVSADNAPRVLDFGLSNTSDLRQVASDLAALFPEMELVSLAHERFGKRDDFLSRFMPHNRRFHPTLQASFDALPSEVHDPDKTGAMISPSDFLERERRERQGAPEGVVVSTSLVIVLEWLMRQALFSKGLTVGAKVRGQDLVSRLVQQVPLSTRTQDLLGVVFPERALGVRDRYAHGLFFGDSRRALERDVAGLSETVVSLRDDLAGSGLWSKILASGARWDGPRRLGSAQEAAFRVQAAGAHIGRQRQTEPLRKHLFLLLERLIPDKRLLAQASFLFWANAADKAPRAAPSEQRFLALLGLLASFEALVRAVVEELGGATLIIDPQAPDLLKAGLAILANEPGHLLAPASLDVAFPGWDREPQLAASIEAVRAVRDLVYHGHWKAWSTSWDEVGHLVIKLMLSVAAAVPLQDDEDADSEFLVDTPGPDAVDNEDVAPPSLDEIRVAAYFLALSRGLEPGRELDDWLRAERDILARRSGGTRTT